MSTTDTGTLVHLDPSTLVIGANVRLDPKTDEAFVESIRLHGVLEPIVAVKTGDTVTVRYGQRRTLGAVQAGRPTVPVVLVEPDSDVDDGQRILEQLAENDHREGITGSDRAKAYAQLAGFGLTAAQIAKGTSRDKAEVETAITVAASATATKATERWAFLTLEDAALIAEFEDDKDAIEKIVVAADRGHSTEHVAQRIRDEKAEQAKRAELATKLEESGVTVVPAPAYDEKKITRLEQLRLGPDDKKAPTTKQHSSCEGHVAWVAWDYSNGKRSLKAIYGCADPRKHGHVKVDPYGGTSAPAGPMTEEQKAERRKVVENNKAWDSAEKVRRDWLVEFAKGTAALKGVEVFLAVEVASGESNERSHGLLPADPAKAAKATPRVALRLAAAQLLADWHTRSGRHTWRNPTARDRRCLNAMIAWGYKPSELEADVAKGPK